MENQEINKNAINSMNIFFKDIIFFENTGCIVDDCEDNENYFEEYFKEIFFNRILNIIGAEFVYLDKEEEVGITKEVTMNDIFVYNCFFDFGGIFFNDYQMDDENFSYFDRSGFYIFNDNNHSFSFAVDDNYILDMGSMKSNKYACNTRFALSKKYLRFDSNMQSDGNNCRIFAIQNVLDIKKYMQESNFSLSDIIEDSICALGNSEPLEYSDNSIIIPFCFISNIQKEELVTSLKIYYENSEDKEYKITIYKNGVEEKKENRKSENRKKEDVKSYNKIAIDLTKVEYKDKEKYWNLKINNTAIKVVKKIYDFTRRYFNDFDKNDIYFYINNQDKGVKLIKDIFKMKKNENDEKIREFIEIQKNKDKKQEDNYDTEKESNNLSLNLSELQTSESELSFDEDEYIITLKERGLKNERQI